MRDMYAATEIYVAPLFTGAGLQNKLLEAMSMAIPCIATNVSNQSLGAKHLHEIIEVSNTDELTNAIIRLLKDAPLRKKIAQNGQQYVHQNYSWEAANEKLYSIINRLL